MFDTSPALCPRPPLRPVAFHLPQYHPCPENDDFWGKGFTEWHNVVRARPRFRGHHQPHIPADLGFYDLRLAEARAAQADLARASGLHGFCYYHYWFAGRRVLNAPVDAILVSGQPDFPFMLCWANENWTRAWDGGDREVILAQTYSDADTVDHARHLAPALTDPRYIRVDGKPAFAVYNSDDIPDPLRWSDLFRETLMAQGLDVYLIRVERWLDRDRRPPAALGFDAALDFQPFSRSFHDWLGAPRPFGARLRRRLDRDLRRFGPRDRHHDMAAFVEFDLAQAPPPYTRFPGVCPSWDNAARRPAGQATIFRNTSPELFAHWLAGKAESVRLSGDAPLLFINAWNEWAEGNHLEPCMHYGHKWLDALNRTSVALT